MKGTEKMRVCLICEGSYPFIPGGVSSWVQMLCTNFKDIDFVIWAIATTREEMHDYAYEIPPNVKEIRTIYLGDARFQHTGIKIHLSRSEEKVLKELVAGSMDDIDWSGVLELAKHHQKQMGDLLMSEAFYNACLEEYKRQDSSKVFLDFLWSMRGIYYPLMYLLSQDIPDADLYHTVSTGYAGALGARASYMNNKPLLVSEHGIYTREREEEIIRSSWIAGDFKDLWISFFKKLSFIAYHRASVVTTLFETNRTLQLELDCPPDKLMIIPNGVDVESFDSCISDKKNNPPIIGAVLRVVPIKSVKTMLLAFNRIKKQVPDVHLRIMGNVNEAPTYYRECQILVDELELKDVDFMGQVNIKEHLKDVDLLLLSSISEGQPLAILEGLAAEIPFVATNVGDCKDLLEGDRPDDDFGPAGVVVPIMDDVAMAKAAVELLGNRDLLDKMGKAGRKRVEKYYNRKNMLESFHKLYEKLGG